MKSTKGSNATLTDKQEKFVQEIIKGKSQREAYKIAYPASLKWLDTAVDTQASILFSDRKVLERYNKLKDRLIKESEDECIITAKQVIQELANIALANGSDFAEVDERSYPEKDKDGNLTGKFHSYIGVTAKPTDEIPREKLSAIAGIEQTQSGIKIKQHDKVKALELLGKHLKLFTEVTENKNENLNTDLTSLTQEERQRRIDELLGK